MKTAGTLAAQIIAGIAFLFAASAIGLPASAVFALGIGLFAVLMIFERKNVTVREARPFLISSGADETLWIGWTLNCLSGFGIVGILAALLVDGAEGLAIIVGLCGGLSLAVIALFPELAGCAPGTLADFFRDRFVGFRGRIGAAIVSALAFLALSALLALAGMTAQVGFGLPFIIGTATSAAMVALLLLPGGASGMPKVRREILGVLLVLLVPAICLSAAASGLPIPQLSWGLLLQELHAAEALAGVENDYMAITPKAFLLTTMAIAAGSAVLPHALNAICAGAERATVREATTPAFIVAFMMLLTLPLFAIVARTSALAAGISLETAGPAQALTQAVSLLSAPGWLLALFALSAFTAITAGAANAALATLAAFGWHRHQETAGGALTKCRMTLISLLILACAVAVFAPGDPVHGFASILTLTGATLFAPLILALHWPRVTGGGVVGGMMAGFVGAIVALLWSASSGTLTYHTGIVALPFSAIATIIISLCSQPQTQGYGLINAPDID